MENQNKKIDFINDALNNILFYDSKLYKVIKANTANIYAFEYVLFKKLVVDVSIMFYNIGDKICYYNYSNTLQPEKIKLKVSHILDTKFKILNNIDDISNIYFIVNIPNFQIKEIKIKDNFHDSLFNRSIYKLKDCYDIRTFINTITTPIINTPNDYYKKIKAEQLHIKKYFNRKYLTSEIKELCETDIEFIKKYQINEYNDIN